MKRGESRDCTGIQLKIARDGNGHFTRKNQFEVGLTGRGIGGFNPFTSDLNFADCNFDAENVSTYLIYI